MGRDREITSKSSRFLALGHLDGRGKVMAVVVVFLLNLPRVDSTPRLFLVSFFLVGGVSRKNLTPITLRAERRAVGPDKRLDDGGDDDGDGWGRT